MIIDECRMLIEKDIGKCMGRNKPQRPALRQAEPRRWRGMGRGERGEIYD